MPKKPAQDHLEAKTHPDAGFIRGLVAAPDGILWIGADQAV